VWVSKKVPLSLSQVIGYNGDTTVNGQKAVTVAATAVATTSGPGTGNTQYCILALANSGAAQALTTNGAPFANLYGCNVMSNTNATCNGHDLNATYGDAHKTSSGCGNTPRSGEPLVPDPLASLASNIPSGSGCNNTYPQEPAKKKDPALPASNQWSGTLGFSGTQVVCGDQQLIGNTQINNTTLVIENGQLDTNGYTLTGDNVTVIFSGTSGGSYEHVPTGGGTIDITPPTSGTWEGIAIYQDPSLTTGVNVSAAGNSPAWNISGAIYLRIPA
jgi:hypothetical protein